MGLNLEIFYCIGFFLLCQHFHCEELLTSSVRTNEDVSISSSTTTLPSTTFSQQNETQTKHSVTSTTTIHTTRLHQVIVSQNQAQNETSIENLCFAKDIIVDDVGDHNFSIHSISGDIMVTIILHHSYNATEIILALVNHVNSIDLLVHNISIGVRIVKILKQQTPESLLEILEVEIDFLEHCVDNPFGIFLSNEMSQYEMLKGKKFEFKIWTMPSIEVIKMRRVAHILKELKLQSNLQNATVKLRSDSLIRANRFESALNMENLCLKNVNSLDDKIYVYVGYSDFLNAATFEQNKSLIIVPLSMQDFIMPNIPNESIVAIEPEIFLNETPTTPSELTGIASTFLAISKSINEAILKECEKLIQGNKVQLKNCEIFNDYHVPEEIPTANLKQALQSLKLQSLEHKMTYNLFEKLTSVNTSHSVELNEISATNFATNVTAVYKKDRMEKISFEKIMQCENSSSHEEPIDHRKETDSFEIDGKFPPKPNTFELDMKDYAGETYKWKIRSELWVAIGLTISTLGILLSLAIVTFIVVRVCLEDVLEGNPIGSIAMLVALIAQFASFFPFTIEPMDLNNVEAINSMCIIRIFVVSVSYCFTFSLMLSRAIMLASIGSEGGFLSHVNGYIQSIICVFSFLVQLGLSTQLLIIFHAPQRHKLTCEDVFYGNWLWGTIGYDAFLLILLVMLTPFIFRSQRNYREGILIAVTSLFCLICWSFWIPMSMINSTIRDMVIPLGCQATGWIILSSLMVPRCFLIVKSIARTDFTQALPSLTSLAFAQANHFISEPSIYECVNPTLQTISNGMTETTFDEYLSPSEVPTLPLRSGGGRINQNINYNEMTPNKMTRF